MEKRQIKIISLGNTVKVRFSGGEVKKFKIVTTYQTDPVNGKISDLSPLGCTLVGSQKGDKKKYIVNGKEFEVEVLEV